MSVSTITNDQIMLVEQSFDSFYPDAYAEVASAFYDELFRRDPSLQPMFPADMREQQMKLMTTFNIAVRGLRHPPSILPALSKLGEMHTRMGIGRPQYQVMGGALVATVQQFAGASFTPEVEAAWHAAFAVITDAMLGDESLVDA